MGFFGNGESRAVRRERARLEVASLSLRRRLIESNILQLGNWVDPREAFLDDRGVPWDIVSIDGSTMGASAEDQIIRPSSDSDLRTMRVRSRILVEANEYAGNALENLVDYTVGSGFAYRVQPKKTVETADAGIVDLVQVIVERLADRLRMPDVESEGVRRAHRDGEFFLRVFGLSVVGEPMIAEPSGPDGPAANLSLRFIEPAEVAKPKGSTNDAETFGILTEPNDVVVPVAYHLTEEGWIAAGEIVHSKLNVDANSKRGMPTFYRLRKRLDAAVDVLENMHLLVRLQGSVGLIRSHEGTVGQVADFQAGKADVQALDGAGKTRYYKELRRPRVIDIPKGMNYTFPPTSFKAAEWSEVVQAVLRPVASRLRMPEWMLTAKLDAKFANAFASESPFVRMIQGQQRIFGEVFGDLVKRLALEAGAPTMVAVRVTRADGRVVEESRPLWEAIDLQVETPSIEVRDAVADANANQVLQQAGVLSRRTWATRARLDYDDERANIDEEMVEIGPEMMPGETGGDDEEEDEEPGEEVTDAER